MSLRARILLFLLVATAGAGLVVATAGAGLVLAAGAGAGTGAGAGLSSASNRQATRTAAARALTRAPLPPGAVAVAAGGDPSAGRRLSGRYDGFQPASPNLIVARRYFRVPDDPASVNAWVRAHPPAGSKPNGTSELGQNGVALTYGTSFSFPARPGVTSQVAVDVNVAAAAGGGTAIRADGWAVWIVPRPGWERVPAAARVVTVEVGGFSGTGGVRSGVTRVLTAPRRVARIVAAIDRLPLSPPGAHGCPAIFYGEPTVRLAFRAAAGGPALASVLEDDCGGLSFTLGGRTAPLLQEAIDLRALLINAGGIAVCPAAALHVTASRPFAPAGFPGIVELPLVAVNRGPGVCGLSGYPRVRLLDARQRPLPTHLHRSRLIHPLAALLAPSASSVTGRAEFDVDWPVGSCRGPRASFVALTPPGARRGVVVAVGSRRAPVDPCGGRISVTPAGGG